MLSKRSVFNQASTKGEPSHRDVAKYLSHAHTADKGKFVRCSTQKHDAQMHYKKQSLPPWRFKTSSHTNRRIKNRNFKKKSTQPRGDFAQLPCNCGATVELLRQTRKHTFAPQKENQWTVDIYGQNVQQPPSRLNLTFEPHPWSDVTVQLSVLLEKREKISF